MKKLFVLLILFFLINEGIFTQPIDTIDWGMSIQRYNGTDYESISPQRPISMESNDEFYLFVTSPDSLLGTKTRIEYTVIGAAVNLAQRMESNAPAGGILVAFGTKAKASAEFTFSEPLAVEVKGYEKPVIAFLLEF